MTVIKTISVVTRGYTECSRANFVVANLLVNNYNNTLTILMNYVGLTYQYLESRNEFFDELITKCSAILTVLKSCLDELNNFEHHGNFEDLHYDYIRYHAIAMEIHYMKTMEIRSVLELKKLMKNIVLEDSELAEMIKYSYDDGESEPLQDAVGFRPFEIDDGAMNRINGDN